MVVRLTRPASGATRAEDSLQHDRALRQHSAAAHCRHHRTAAGRANGIPRVARTPQQLHWQRADLQAVAGVTVRGVPLGRGGELGNDGNALRGAARATGGRWRAQGTAPEDRAHHGRHPASRSPRRAGRQRVHSPAHDEPHQGQPGIPCLDHSNAHGSANDPG